MMKTICIGIMGMLATVMIVNADGYSELDNQLFAAKDFPFPPGQSNTIEEAHASPSVPDNDDDSKNDKDESSEESSED